MKRAILAPVGTYLAISVRKFCCFVSFDNVNSLNCTFTSNGIVHTIVSGMYSGETLATELNAMTNLGFTCTYDVKTHTYTGYTTNIEWGDDSLTENFLRMLGWTKHLGKTLTATFSGNKVDLGGGFHSAHIVCDLPLDTVCTRANATRNLLAVAPFTAHFGDMQVYQPYDQLAIPIRDRCLSSIKIRLETNRRNLVPLAPGTEWSLGLIVHTIFSTAISKARSLTPIIIGNNNHNGTRQEKDENDEPSRSQGGTQSSTTSRTR
jgi:hypothetical protein